MSMFNKIFPYKLQLQIFQLGEYNKTKFIQWVISHFFIRKIENKKLLVWTTKARLIFFLSFFLVFLSALLGFDYWGILGLIIAVILATQAYIFIVISAFLLVPFEHYQELIIINRTKARLTQFKNLKIVGITGSYGKTSTKEFLYQILKTKYKVLKTPGSFNTVLGIAKVVDLELDDSYEFFICEMGAYKRGDIKEICDIVHPKYGILTGINEQHLDSFGSLKNTTKGKFELIESLPDNGFGLVNIDNKYIRENVSNYHKKLIPYGFSDKEFSISDVKQTSNLTHFSLILDGKKYKAQTNLIGNSNMQNIIGAASMAFNLGMRAQDIVSAISNIKAVAHRLEIKEFDGMTLIDDAYNSNVDGFKSAIKLLESFDRPKILVTPGIVDLADKTILIHEDLGKMLGKIDHIILVGNSDRSRGLKLGIEDKNKIREISSIKEVWKTIENLKLKNPVVLLENDLPDNYN